MEELVILTGFMGVGKTTTGRALARILGWEFVDLDHEIEGAAGKSISAIFAEEGEESFRNMESRALRQSLERTRAVVATGGGVLLREENRRLLAGKRILYLHASPQECISRLRTSGVTRPLLEGSNPEETLVRIYGERQAAYESLGERVDTGGRRPEELAEAIAEGILLSRQG